MPSSASSTSLPETPQECLQLCIQTFTQSLNLHRTNQTPSTTLQVAITQANAQASAMGLAPLFPTPPTISSGFHQGFCELSQQPFLSTLYIATALRIRRIMSTLHRFGNEIKEVRIGTGSVALKFEIRPIEDTCYLEYVDGKQRWRAASPPSGISFRVTQETELIRGCRQLLTVAGCVFKTAETTPQQRLKPIDIPGRSLKRVMRSLGFCTADTGSLYRVYTSRFGRSIKPIVTIIPLVDEHGNNQGSCAESSSLRTSIEVLDSENVITAIRRLREQSRNSLITSRGQHMVRKKFSNSSSIVLM